MRAWALYRMRIGTSRVMPFPLTAICQTLRGRATDSHWESDAAAPKRWTASSFLNILDGRLQDFSKVQGFCRGESIMLTAVRPTLKDLLLLHWAAQQRSKPHGSQAARSHNNVLRTSLDSTRLLTLEKEMMEVRWRSRQLQDCRTLEPNLQFCSVRSGPETIERDAG